jgi:hypothetical protein
MGVLPDHLPDLRQLNTHCRQDRRVARDLALIVHFSSLPSEPVHHRKKLKCTKKAQKRTTTHEKYRPNPNKWGY